MLRLFQRRRPTKTASAVSAAAIASASSSRFNPLRGLDTATIVRYLEAFEAGDFSHLWRTMRAMERRDDVWKIVAAKTRKDAARRDWRAVPLDGCEKDPIAADQADILTAFYKGITVTDFSCRNVPSAGVRPLVEGMLRAYNDQYHVHELVWRPRPDGNLSAEFIRCPLDWFAIHDANLCLNTQATTYKPLAPAEWLITASDGVGVACAVAYTFKKLALGDWAVYSGRCGHPGIHGKTNATKGSEQWTSFVNALKAFGREWCCATGLDDVLEKVDLSITGTLPYPALVERMDRAIAALHRGADLSTMSAGSGSGEGASLQGDESDLICADNCETITATLRSQVDPYVLAWYYGPTVTIRAGFELVPPQPDTVAQDLQTDQALVNLGVRLSKSDALQRYNRREADPADAEDTPLTPPAAPDSFPPFAPGPVPGAAPAPAASASPEAAAAEGDIQKAAMNGAQIQALQGILADVADGQLAPEAAKLMIKNGFPLLDPASVDAMIASASTFTPRQGLANQAPDTPDPLHYEAAALDALAEARRTNLAPIAQRLDAALALDDPAQLRNALASILQDLPATLAEASQNTQDTETLLRILEDAVALGATR